MSQITISCADLPTNTPEEEWRPVTEALYDEYYAVSNCGRVARLKNISPRFLKGRSAAGALIKPFLMMFGRKTIDKRGTYLGVNLRLPKQKQKTFYVHRLVASTFINNLKRRRTVNHIDGQKDNNFVGNLEWATDEENLRHAVKNGLLRNRGTSHYAARLSMKQVREIRSQHSEGELNQRELARMFKVTDGTISAIVRNLSYKE